jgi:hypothetical protein
LGPWTCDVPWVIFFPFSLIPYFPWCVFLKLSHGVICFFFFVSFFFAGVVTSGLFFLWPYFPALAFAFITPCITPTLYMLNDSMGVSPGLFLIE